MQFNILQSLKAITNQLIVYLPALFLIYTAYAFVNHQLWGIANDPGLGWHLKTGQLIIETASIPDKDPFLFNGQNYEWVSNQWLADVVLYAIYVAGSWSLLTILVAIGIILSLWLALFFPALKKTRSILFITASIVFAQTLHYVHFVVRPVFFQLVFFIILVRCLWLLYSALQQDQPVTRKTNALYILLIVLFCLWANIHPSFVVACGFLGLFWLTVSIERHFKILKLTNVEFIKLTIATFACQLVTLINPYNFKLHQFILFYMTAENVRVQDEWLPLSSASEYVFMFYTILSIFVGLLVLARRSVLTGGLFPIIAVLPFCWLSISGVRYVPFFAVTCFVAIVHLLEQLPTPLKCLISNTERQINKCLQACKVVFPIAIIAIPIAIFCSGYLYPEKSLAPDVDRYPYKSVALLNELSRSTERPLIILNDVNWGGFITFHSNNNLKPTVDDRLFFFSPKYVKDYLNLMNEPSREIFSNLLTDQHNYILASPKKKFGTWLKANYAELVLLETDTEILLRSPMRGG